MQDADFYIMNAANVPKHDRDFYKSIGFLIVDEVHIIMAEKMSQCMRYITPRYALGLSATPYRTDGLDVLLDMYFGTHKIVRKLFRKHVAYRVDTGFKPDVKLNRMGKVDWGSVLESQCSNRDRNELIVSLVKFFPDRVFLVLCKRVDQAKYLVDRLEEEGEDVTSLIGSNQVFERSSRVLVGTVQKTGVGFDHPRLNSLILASDVEQYFVQYLGRVFRREDTVPWIFDLLDDYPLLKKHYNTRRGVYSEHGGLVKDFCKEFPEFSHE
jgi:superfamily II DNA or RNA helicase